MITVHHLNNSRSQRILWLLEELSLPYEIVSHTRTAADGLAPPSLRAVHPLGKAPVIDDDGLVLAESGAIVEYLMARYGDGRLSVDPGAPEHDHLPLGTPSLQTEGIPLIDYVSHVSYC